MKEFRGFAVYYIKGTWKSALEKKIQLILEQLLHISFFLLNFANRNNRKDYEDYQHHYRRYRHHD